MAEEPPVTWSVASEKLPLNRVLTAAPAGLAVSSLIAASVALPEATGASLTSLTTREAVSVAVENAVWPPLAEVSASAPLLPDVRSQARNVIALASVPL